MEFQAKWPACAIIHHRKLKWSTTWSSTHTVTRQQHVLFSSMEEWLCRLWSGNSWVKMPQHFVAAVTQWATLRRRVSENGPAFKSPSWACRVWFNDTIIRLCCSQGNSPYFPSCVLSVCNTWQSRLGWGTAEEEMTKQKYLSNQGRDEGVQVIR